MGVKMVLKLFGIKKKYFWFLAFLLLFGQTLDILYTKIGLGIGLEEGNLFPKFLMQTFGFYSTIISTILVFSIIIWFAYYFLYSKDKSIGQGVSIGLYIAVIFQFLVVVFNGIYIISTILGV